MTPYRSSIENLEERRLLAAVIKSTDVVGIAAGDGTKANGNDIIVRFDAPVSGTTNISKMRMFGYAYNTLTGGNDKKTINILSATINSAGQLVLRTDAQVRKGAQLDLSAGAVSDVTNTSKLSIRTKKGLNRDRFTLALRAFRPNDKSYFGNDKLVGGATPVVANTAASEASVRAELDSFLTKKVNNEKTITAAQKTAALAQYDSSANKAIVPAHNLRAGIVSLIGTIGAPAIDFYFGTANSTGKAPVLVNFDGTQISSAQIVAEGTYTSSGRFKLIFNPNYAGESFVALSGRLAHEAMHDDSATNHVDSAQEEGINNFVESVIYAQQLATDFTYVQSKNQYTLQSNYRLMLALNSGDNQFPRVGMSDAPIKGGIANPGFDFNYGTSPAVSAKNVASFYKDVRNEFAARNVPEKPSTITTATTRAILTKLTGNTYTSATTFGDALIKDIDLGQDVLADQYVAQRISRILQLKVA
jgi:hypothetical protein